MPLPIIVIGISLIAGAGTTEIARRIINEYRQRRFSENEKPPFWKRFLTHPLLFVTLLLAVVYVIMEYIPPGYGITLPIGAILPAVVVIVIIMDISEMFKRIIIGIAAAFSIAAAAIAAIMEIIPFGLSIILVGFSIVMGVVTAVVFKIERLFIIAYLISALAVLFIAYRLTP